MYWLEAMNGIDRRATAACISLFLSSRYVDGRLTAKDVPGRNTMVTMAI